MDNKNVLGNIYQIIIGLAIVIFESFILSISVSEIGGIFTFSLLVVMLVATVMGGVRLVKGKIYKSLGVTLLSISVPWLSILLLFGSCIGMISG